MRRSFRQVFFRDPLETSRGDAVLLVYRNGLLLTPEQKSPSVARKLDSVMARLDRLCSEDNEDVVLDESEHERRAKLFEWVV